MLCTTAINTSNAIRTPTGRPSKAGCAALVRPFAKLLWTLILLSNICAEDCHALCRISGADKQYADVGHGACFAQWRRERTNYWTGLLRLCIVYCRTRIVCEAGSTKRYGVRPPVCSSIRPSAAFSSCSSVRRVCCCGPGGLEIHSLLQQRRANAGSATLLAYVCGWT